mmetsp:Transcript_19340/g.40772  ORF Transcript_19340/g.40772 Transcript_19340/m.40772 type:complete len:345 (-) Transcript_19340:174-1208(-)
MSGYQPSTTIFLRPEEFAHDAESRLGRANGNTYQRKPGIENIHDGQIMVRLKKKRFIILDYGYIPNDHDHEIANAVPHISIPKGAGTAKCATKECPRVGVPVLMYDSEPNEPMSLYLRGGLCFSCQRNLNEKRRTQRKRKAEEGTSSEAQGGAPSDPTGNGRSRFKFNDQIVELNPDAVVINGPVDGARTRGPDYRCPEIGSDLIRIVSDLNQETRALLQHSSGLQLGLPTISNSTVNAMYQKAFLSVSKATFLLTQWKASWDETLAANAAAAVSANFDSRVLDEAVASATATMHAQGFPDHQLGFQSNTQGNASGEGNAAAHMQPLMSPPDAQQNKSDQHVEI